MAITLRGEAGETIRVSGDIETELRVPYDDGNDCFYIGFSDGTLVEGRYGEDQQYLFSVAAEGAGIPRIRRIGRSDVLTLEWKIEWVAVADCMNCAVAESEPVEPLPDLPGLFTQLAEQFGKPSAARC